MVPIESRNWMSYPLPQSTKEKVNDKVEQQGNRKLNFGGWCEYTAVDIPESIVEVNLRWNNLGIELSIARPDSEITHLDIEAIN